MKESSNLKAGSVPGRPSMFRIGPGLAIAILVAVIVGGNAIKSQLASRQASSGPIIENRTVVGGSNQSGPAPEVKFLLDHRASLRLTPQQVQRLTAMQLDWDRTYGPKLKDARAAAGKLRDYLGKSRNNQRTPIAQIQKEAEPLIAASAEITRAKRHYWSRAMTVLTPEQRKAAMSARKKNFSAKLKAISDVLAK
jgi:hypothetical protein